MSGSLRRRAVVLLAACAIALPFLLWGFRAHQLASVATHAIAILGLNLIAGQATYWLSILLLVGSMFGGMTSVWDAVVGGLFLQFWPDIASLVSRDLVLTVFGALLVLSMRFMPGGVAEMVTAQRPGQRP